MNTETTNEVSNQELDSTTVVELSPYEVQRNAFQANPPEQFSISKEAFDRLVHKSAKAFVISSNVLSLQTVSVKALPPQSDVLDLSYEAMKEFFVPNTEDLLITFVNEARYLYKFVPPNLRTQMIEGDSAGKFFAAYVKNQYITYKVTEETTTEDDATQGDVRIIVFTLTK